MVVVCQTATNVSCSPVCSAKELDDDTSVIFVYASKRTPEDLVSTEDLGALGLTYKDLVSLYAVLGGQSGCYDIFTNLQLLIDPETKALNLLATAEAKGISLVKTIELLTGLLFPEAAAAASLRAKKRAELKEQQRKIQEEIDKLM